MTRHRTRWALLIVPALSLPLNGCGDNPDTAPTHSDIASSSPEATAPTRPIVYSDYDAHGPDHHPGTINVGERVVNTGSGFIHMDVTDDGAVYATGGYLDDGRVWFTDGGTPTQIGSHACAAPHGAANTVVTDSSGSLAAWFDCTPGQDSERYRPALRHQMLVVYDTGTGHEVMREHFTRCQGCSADAIIGDHIYLTWVHSTHGRDVGTPLEFDMATGRISKVKLAKGAGDAIFPGTYDGESQAYLDDIRSHPRGLVIGDSWATGTPTPVGGFSVVGKRLVPESHLQAFDTGTRRPVRLHLPAGYHRAVDFGLFEWLNDDTVALIGPTGYFRAPGYGDILRCHLADGHCNLVAHGRGLVRVIPSENLG